MKDIQPKKLKIAIVYDWIDRWGGIERVLLTLKEMLPQADFYTSVYDKEKAAWAKGYSIYSSFMQKLPRTIRESRILSLAFYPLVFENFDFSAYDLVFSVSSSFAKSVVTKPQTVHLCYLLTPSRYLWLYRHPLKNKIPHFLYRTYESYMKRWDLAASSRPDSIISLSETTATRCKDIYARDSQVIYPPFDVTYWENLSPEHSHMTGDISMKNMEYYLLVARLEPYKKVNIAVEAFCGRLQDQLLVVGAGSMEKILKKKATGNIHFIHHVSDARLKWLYLHAKALIMPQEEDFGYVSLEAQLHGLPVIAYRRGGARETVLENKTGLFFEEQTSASLSSTLERFGKISYNFSHEAKRLGPLQAQKFSKLKFEKEMERAIINSVQANRDART